MSKGTKRTLGSLQVLKSSARRYCRDNKDRPFYKEIANILKFSDGLFAGYSGAYFGSKY